jgi:glutamate racemase
MNDKPIIFLDSGIGGIPYADFFRSRNKSEKLVYVADRENFPYGPRSKRNVIDLSLSVVKKLAAFYEPKILVVACNAISVSALQALREGFPALPVVGTVPALKPAMEKSRKRRIGVIGTQRAVEDPYIAKLAAQFGPDCAIVGEAAPELVEFVERSWLDADKAERLKAVEPWIKKIVERGADTLVLACTHFLLLKEEFIHTAGDSLMVFDSVEGVIKRVEALLDESGGKLRSGAAEAAGSPLMIVTGKRPLEDHWEKLCLHFGFALETAR